MALVATPCSASHSEARALSARPTRPFGLSSLASFTLALTPAAHLVVAQAPAGGGGTGSNSSSVACGWASQCPQSSPCCSEYGFCAAGTSCLGGCNPQGSYGEGFCAPMPVCSSANVSPPARPRTPRPIIGDDGGPACRTWIECADTRVARPQYTFADDSRIQRDHSAWNGDTSKYDWTLDKRASIRPSRSSSLSRLAHSSPRATHPVDSSNPPLVQNNALVLTLTEDGGGTRVSTTRNVLYGTIQASIKTVGVAGVVTAFITMVRFVSAQRLRRPTCAW